MHSHLVHFCAAHCWILGRFQKRQFLCAHIDQVNFQNPFLIAFSNTSAFVPSLCGSVWARSQSRGSSLRFCTYKNRYGAESVAISLKRSAMKILFYLNERNLRSYRVSHTKSWMLVLQNFPKMRNSRKHIPVKIPKVWSSQIFAIANYVIFEERKSFSIRFPVSTDVRKIISKIFPLLKAQECSFQQMFQKNIYTCPL